MNPKFIISHLDVQLGPFDEAELKGKWVKGEILPIDYVYDEAKQDWVLLSERFSWASGRAAAEAPPPLRDVTVKKARPPEPASAAPAAPAQSTQVAAPTPAAPVSVGKAAPAPAQQQVTAAAAAAAVAVQPPAPPAPPAPKKAPSIPAAQVKLVDGCGELSLSPLAPGNVEVVLQQAAGDLRLQSPLKIHVRPAEPFSIEWNAPAQQTAGKELEIQVRALDRAGNPCAHYEDQFVIRVNGSDGTEFVVNLQDGHALVKIQHTKAENWRLSLHYNGNRVLKMPEDRMLEWQPGAATRLILDGPGEYIAGHPLKVQVKAVDEFGNLAKTFHGTVVLEVKAS